MRNHDNLFYLEYLKEFNKVLLSARISMRKGYNYRQGGLTVGEISNSAAVKTLIHRNEGYKFLSKVRGSAPYWEKIMKDWVYQLGLLAFLQQTLVRNYKGNFDIGRHESARKYGLVRTL